MKHILKQSCLLCLAMFLFVQLARARGPEWESTRAEVFKLYDEGRYERAVDVARRALEEDEAVGPDYPSVAQSLNTLAALYRVLGQYALAKPLYERSLAITENALDPSHTEVANSLKNLAGLYDAQGQYTQAEPLYLRSLAIFEKALGPDHRNVAAVLEDLAILYGKIGDTTKQKEFDARVRKIRSIN
jgi:tetratricopeptide (TPR) repeat protein